MVKSVYLKGLQGVFLEVWTFQLAVQSKRLERPTLLLFRWWNTRGPRDWRGHCSGGTATARGRWNTRGPRDRRGQCSGGTATSRGRWNICSRARLLPCCCPRTNIQRWRLPSRGRLQVYRRNCPRTLGKLLLEWSLYWCKLVELVDAPSVSIALPCTTTPSPGAWAPAMPAIVCMRGGVSTSVGALLGPDLAGMLALPCPT